MAEKTWHSEATRRWGQDALSISGEGPYALLAHCGWQINVTLWPTRDEAEEQKRTLDELGCGVDQCPRNHEIVDLGSS
jgi:hypothetical protein